MNILIVGSGGREHAIAAKLRRDDPGASIYVAPGNPGTDGPGQNVPLSASDLGGLADFASDHAIDVTVVGPEQPLADGIAEVFEARGLPLFGPSRRAARLESSKVFSKQLMRDCGVPTAGFEIFTEYGRAADYVTGIEPPIVVKASGLAAGKGAVVAESVDDALTALREMLVEDRFGEAGREVVVEEFMPGAELSVFFLTDGENAVPLVPSRDHKRRFEGDRGPNTGGMGAYAPVADGTAELVEQARREVADPILRGMAERGYPYRGFLYAGLMLTPEGVKVVEFNCRLGDPEAQVVLPLTGAGLAEPMAAIARGESVAGWTAGVSTGAALVTVVVSGGYPGPYPKGVPMDLPVDLEAADVHLYHAGTAREDGRLVTSGGRVVGVTGLGSDLAEAATRSREAAARVRFEGAAWRTDIGHSEIETSAG
ncbi:MAG: phosphoribosylamine--glycine ligase [Gemmatimonadetes bacterium]|nr:phosphoribosylamine--glycine ligase [Gemmatimonadota bacterium]NNK62649.1 phosphoribosylamine--glycine ligase [Gemmatimonadota bacterium]